MKINILNSSPESIKDLFHKIESFLPSDMCISPISIELSFIKINEDDNKINCTAFDFVDKNDQSADIQLEDANLLFDDIVYDHDNLKINGDNYHLSNIKQSFKHKKRTPK